MAPGFAWHWLPTCCQGCQVSRRRRPHEHLWRVISSMAQHRVDNACTGDGCRVAYAPPCVAWVTRKGVTGSHKQRALVHGYPANAVLINQLRRTKDAGAQPCNRVDAGSCHGACSVGVEPLRWHSNVIQCSSDALQSKTKQSSSRRAANNGSELLHPQSNRLQKHHANKQAQSYVGFVYCCCLPVPDLDSTLMQVLPDCKHGTLKLAQGRSSLGQSMA